MWVGTFHATAVRILRREAPGSASPSSFVIFDEDDTRAAIKRVMDELKLDPKRYPPARFSHGISQAKNELKRPGRLPEPQLPRRDRAPRLRVATRSCSGARAASTSTT